MRSRCELTIEISRTKLCAMPQTDRTVVLDLDACLIVSFFDKHNTDEDHEAVDAAHELKRVMENTRMQEMRRRFYKIRSKGTNYDFCGLRRVDLDAFISFCFRYFKYVIVWSAGDRNYVHAIVNEIFKHHHRPHYVLTRDDLAYVDDDDYYKPIRVINELYSGVAPLDKTVFVDDKNDNFRENTGNGFTIPVCNIFAKDGSISAGEDTALRCLMNWLRKREVLQSEDIRSLDKSDAFTYTGEDANDWKAHNDDTHAFFFAPMTHA